MANADGSESGSRLYEGAAASLVGRPVGNVTRLRQDATDLSAHKAATVPPTERGRSDVFCRSTSMVAEGWMEYPGSGSSGARRGRRPARCWRPQGRDQPGVAHSPAMGGGRWRPWYSRPGGRSSSSTSSSRRPASWVSPRRMGPLADGGVRSVPSASGASPTRAPASCRTKAAHSRRAPAFQLDAVGALLAVVAGEASPLSR